MTLLSFALRVREVKELQKAYAEKHDPEILLRLQEREAELDRLVQSIILAPREY